MQQALHHIVHGGRTYLVKRFKFTVAAAQTDSVVLAASEGRFFVVLSMIALCSATTTAKFSSKPGTGATTDLTDALPIAENGGFVLPEGCHGWLQTRASEALTISTGGDGGITGFGSYIEVSP